MNHIGQTWRLAATAVAVATVLMLAAAGYGAGPRPDTGAVPEGQPDPGQVCASLADSASHDTTTDTRAGRRWLVTGHQIDGGG